MKIAKNDRASLFKVLEIAEKELKKFPKDKTVSDGAAVFQSQSASSSAPSGAAAGANAG